MRIKKGFTLAEILIVLMVIGVIATMTLPALMRGVTESQYKTAYKKAFNTISNLATMERVNGNLSTIGNKANRARFYESLVTNMNIASYVSGIATNNTSVISLKAYTPCIEITLDDGTTTTYGATGEGVTCAQVKSDASTDNVWVVGEDNIAYTVFTGGSSEGEQESTTTCSDKATINSQTTAEDAAEESCFVVVADVNGLSKAPNTFETQKSNDSASSSGYGANVANTSKMATLTGDQYPIYIGSDGATAGSKVDLVTGRIMGDIK